MNVVYNYEYVKNFFKNEGYILLKGTYVNIKSIFTYKCPAGHIRDTTFANFKSGKRCKICSGWKYTYDQLKDSFEKEDYTLLSTEYKGIYGKMDYICPKGHNHSVTWNNWHKHSSRCPTCYRNKVGIEHQNSKGNVVKLNLPLYETYSPQIEKYEQTHLIQQNGLDLLGVNCLYCNKIFIPTAQQVKHRKNAIIGIDPGENRFYCSDGCKQACPIYKKVFWPEGYAPATSREMQPQFRKMVLERDNWACQKCGASKDKDINTELHAHHIDPVINNPIESCDVDNGITLCKECHTVSHKVPGCGARELHCT